MKFYNQHIRQILVLRNICNKKIENYRTSFTKKILIIKGTVFGKYFYSTKLT